jgi:hypothetical protein
MSFGPNRSTALATWLRDKLVGLSKPKILRSPLVVIALFAVVTCVGLAAVARPVLAMDISGFVGLLIAWILHYVVAFEGWLLIKMVGILIWVAQYNGFITAKPVETGWFIVRDIVNMFYILMLLVIAFGTILDVDQYNYSKTLPKLLLSAVLVNFSRTFVGIFIDISQVIMLTFVNGFSEAATGNFANAFHINKMLSAEAKIEGGSDDASAMKLVASWILAAMLVGFSLVIVFYLVVVLVLRIVYLWVLVIVSPAAYFLRGVPMKSAEKYYGEWWGMLIQRLVAGPFIAFFLWLSLLTTSQDTLKQGGFETGGDTGESNGVDMGMFSGDDLKSYIIAMALLIGGVDMAGKMAGVKLGDVTGAPGKAWKGAKSVVSAGKSAMDFTNRQIDKTPLGRGRDALKGGLLNLGAKMGSMSAAKSLAEHREAVQKKGGDNKWIDKLTPDERTKYLKSSKLPNALKSPERINMEREVLKQHMTDLTRGKGLPANPPKGANETDEAYKQRSEKYAAMVRNDYQTSRDRLKEIGSSTNDRSVEDFIKATNKARPDLIVNEGLRKKKPSEYEEQLKELRKSGREMSGSKFAEQDASAFVPQSVMFMNPQALKSALSVGNLNSDQTKALSGMGITEDMTKEQIDHQLDHLKAANSNFLLKEDREALANKQRESLAVSNEMVKSSGAYADPKARQNALEAAKKTWQEAEQNVLTADPKDIGGAMESRKKAEKEYNRVAAIDNAFNDRGNTLKSIANLSREGGMNKETVDLFAAAGPAGVTAMAEAMKNGVGVDAAALAGQKELATGVAEAMEGSDIAKLPTELAQVLRGVFAENGYAGKVFDAGGSAKEAFGGFGYNEATGDMRDSASFQNELRKNKDWAQKIGADEIGKNGGVNDLSLAMLGEMNMDDVRGMGRGGNEEGATAMVGAALAIRNADTAKLVEDYKNRMKAGGMSEKVAEGRAQNYSSRLEKAKEGAEKLIGDIGNSDSPLSAALEAATAERDDADSAESGRAGKALWKKEMPEATLAVAEQKRAEKQRVHEAKMATDPKYAAKHKKKADRAMYKASMKEGARDVADQAEAERTSSEYAKQSLKQEASDKQAAEEAQAEQQRATETANYQAQAQAEHVRRMNEDSEYAVEQERRMAEAMVASRKAAEKAAAKAAREETKRANEETKAREKQRKTMRRTW